MVNTCRLILCALALLLTACAHTDDTSVPISQDSLDPKEQIIVKVRGTDRLYTTEYVVHKIVTYDDIVRLKGTVFSQKFDLKLPQGDRKVLIPMEARIKAYIDFSGFSKDNVTINADSTVTVILPDPVIMLTSTKIDHGGIKTFVDIGRSRFSSAELSEFEKQGRAAIIAAIPKMGIEETARYNAYNLLVPLISEMGYRPEQITINFSKEYTDADYINMLIKNARGQ